MNGILNAAYNSSNSSPAGASNVMIATAAVRCPEIKVATGIIYLFSFDAYGNMYSWVKSHSYTNNSCTDNYIIHKFLDVSNNFYQHL